MTKLTQRYKMTEADLKICDLPPSQILFVETFLRLNGVLKNVAIEMGKTLPQVYGIASQPKIVNAINYMSNSVNAIPDVLPEEPYKVEMSSRLKLLWAIAQETSSKIYDKEGNEILMNPASSIAAIRTISDLQGDFAPKEQFVTVDIKDDRSVEEIQNNIKMLMAEYQQLSLNGGATDNQVNKVLKGPKPMIIEHESEEDEDENSKYD